MSLIKVVRHSNNQILSEQEIEAHLFKEGYQPFKWNDVAGVTYPRHVHTVEECIWVVKGEIIFEVDGQEYHLKAGDKIYLPANARHSAKVPTAASVTYFIGQKNN